MRPGDLYLYNDFYGSQGAVSHNNDMVFIAPVFMPAAGSSPLPRRWGHLWDIGGMVPGSISPAANDVFQEGIVIPPTRVLREGVWNDDLIRMFLRNTRFPDMVQGDMSAIMAAVQLGRRRMEEIACAYGIDVLSRRPSPPLLTQTEKAARAAIAERLPDGRFTFRDWIDCDCVTDNSYSVCRRRSRSAAAMSASTIQRHRRSGAGRNQFHHGRGRCRPASCGLYLTSREPGVRPIAVSAAPSAR